MNTHYIKTFVAATLLLFTGGRVHAQKSALPASAQAARPAPETWKKQVARTIYLPADTTRKEEDTTLVEVLANAVNAGKVLAFADSNFTVPLTKKAFADLFVTKPDTVTIVDPVTGVERMIVTIRDFKYEAISAYKVLENWSFAPATGKTEVQILGIAPVDEAYGPKTMFWVYYNDVSSLLSTHSLGHPQNTLAARIWEDHVSERANPEPKKQVRE